MRKARKSGKTPAERVENSALILRELRRAVRDALLRHKRLGNSIVVWRDGRVVWVPPDKIRVGEEE